MRVMLSPVESEPYERDLRGLLYPFSMWRHSEKITIYDLGEQILPDTETAYTVILDLPAFRIEKLQF